MPRTSADRSIVVSSLADALPVTESSTTSRTLVDNERVRVVAFAFDAGEQLTDHTAAMPVVVHLLTGSMRFMVAGETHQLAAGDCIYLAANEPHALEALEPSLMSLVLVRDDTQRGQGYDQSR